jgi:MFS family permease
MQPKVRQNPLGTRDFWLMWFTALGTQYSLYLVLTWLPFYLQEARGLTGSAAGVASSLMPLLAAPSGIAAGWLSDRFGTRRKILVTLVPCSLVALALIGFSKTYAMLYIGLALYGITGKLTIDPLIVAAVQDISGDQGRASALGVLNFASTVSMVAAPAVTGYLVDVTGSFSSAFWVAILLAGVSSVAVSLTREQRATLREN